MLDQISDEEYGEPYRIYIIPDEHQVNTYPEVISGFYASKIKRISLKNTDELFQKVIDRIGSPNSSEVRIVGTLKLEDYATSVECESRHYFGKIVSFTISESSEAINNEKISGC